MFVCSQVSWGSREDEVAAKAIMEEVTHGDKTQTIQQIIQGEKAEKKRKEEKKKEEKAKTQAFAVFRTQVIVVVIVGHVPWYHAVSCKMWGVRAA